MPQPEKYEIELVNGKTVKLVFKYGKDTVDRKVHLIMGVPVVWSTGKNGIHIGTQSVWDDKSQTYRRGPVPKLAKDKKGKTILIPVEVPACFLEITLSDGTKMKRQVVLQTARRVGAIRRAARKPSPTSSRPSKGYAKISYPDRRKIMEVCVPQVFRKHGKTKKVQPLPAGTTMVADAPRRPSSGPQPTCRIWPKRRVKKPRRYRPARLRQKQPQKT